MRLVLGSASCGRCSELVVLSERGLVVSNMMTFLVDKIGCFLPDFCPDLDTAWLWAATAIDVLLRSKETSVTNHLPLPLTNDEDAELSR